MLLPPSPPKVPRTHWKWTILIIIFGFVLCGTGGYFVVRSFLGTEFVQANDNLFGDQNLKTAVALVELHKVRHGRYPASLKDLEFTGQWDQMALGSVSYTCNSDGSAYYLEVVRGWIGKPTFTMPQEFWRGTGYSPALRPSGP